MDETLIKMSYELRRLSDAVEKQSEVFEKHTIEDSVNNQTHIGLLQKCSNQMRETQECFRKLDKKLDLNIQQVNYELKDVNKQNEHQNELLSKQIESVNALNDILSINKEVNEKRFDKLEEPSIATRYLATKWKYWTGGVILVTSVVTLIVKIKGL